MGQNFGETLKEMRIERGMSQEDFAKILGTTKQVISRYENGQRTPKITIAQQYADKLNVPLQYLLGEKRRTADESLSKKLNIPVDMIEPDPSGKLINAALASITDQASWFRASLVLSLFARLNDDGQEVAVQRIHELTEIPRYQQNEFDVKAAKKDK